MKISMKQFVIAASLFSMFALSGHLATAQASWKLKEVRVFNKIDGNYGTITAERYDASGGSVDIQLSGKIHSFCPGGFEKLRFTWDFAGSIREVATGGGVSATLRAGHVSKSQHCRGSLAADSYMEMRSSSGGSSRYFSSPEYNLLDERFESFKNPRIFAGQGEQNGVAAVKVRTHAFNPKKSWAYFEVYISVPTQEGGGLWYVYLYENTGGSTGSNRGDGRPVWGSTNYSAGLNGATLTYYRGTTHQQCQADCENNPKCKGFTLIRAGAYSPNDPPMCYLMSEATSFAPSPCCISAIKNESGSSKISDTDDSNAFNFNNGRLEETLFGTLLWYKTSYNRR